MIQFLSKRNLRIWATPLTIGSFLLMLGTGVVMFFNWNPGLIAVVHKWFSWVFLLGLCGHIAINIGPFLNHLKSRWGRGSIALCTIILILSFNTWGKVTGPRLKMPVQRALAQAPLSVLAEVSRTSLPDLLDKMKRNGITATGEESVLELSEKNHVDEHHLLGIIFLPEESL